MKQFIIGLLLLLCHGGLMAADKFPPQFIAKYKLYAKGFSVGEGTRIFSRLKNGHFQFQTVAETTGFVSLFKKIRIEERSVFTRLKNGKIRPLKYIYRQTGSKSRTNTILFDWSKGIATNTFKGQTKTIVLREGTLDRLLYQFVLMVDQKKASVKCGISLLIKGKSKSISQNILAKNLLRQVSVNFRH